MSVIDDVKQRTDIAEIIGQYVPLKKSGKYLVANCPFHNEKTPSFYVYPEQQSWHCFGACSTGGDVLSFVMKKENMDFGEALRLLADRAGIELPRFNRESDADKEHKERLYQVNEAAAVYFSKLLKEAPEAAPARAYFEKRGLTAETVAAFRLGFSLNSWEALRQHLTEAGFTAEEIQEAGLVSVNDEGRAYDRFRNRLIFPINDDRGRVIGFGARVLDDALPKYLNSPQTPLFDKSSVIYALDAASPAIRQQDQVVLVEGYMDVITAHQHGYTNVVAAMGTAVTERQILRLKRLSRNLVLALDSDTAGEEAMLRCVGYENTLEAEVRVIIMPQGKDPDEYIKSGGEEWQKLVDEARPVMDYTIDLLTSRLDMASANGQSQAVSQLGAIILEIIDPVRQAYYRQKLARVTDKDLRTIDLALNSLKRSVRSAAPAARKTVAAEPPAKLLSSPIEEQCLSLMLQHFEIKEMEAELPAEYFGNSENREIYQRWHQAADIEALKNSLDMSIWSYFEALLSRSVLATRIEERYNKYVSRLREEHLRRMEKKKGAVLAMEAEMNGSGADLAKLQEQGLTESAGLREIFTEKGRKGRVPRS